MISTSRNSQSDQQYSQSVTSNEIDNCLNDPFNLNHQGSQKATLTVLICLILYRIKPEDNYMKSEYIFVTRII